MKKQQSGFTLVEIAIVMVIIGLLLGGVLKGQEVITNARIKNINNDFSGVSAAIFSYQDRYKQLPGDDSAADAHVNGVTSAAATVGDGVIDGAYDAAIAGAAIADTDAESALVWHHLRLAGLIAGDTASAQQPLNAFGGQVGLENAAGNAAFSGLAMVFGNVPTDMAIILEAQNDDGVPTTGGIRTDAAIAGNAYRDAAGDPVVTTVDLAFEM